MLIGFSRFSLAVAMISLGLSVSAQTPAQKSRPAKAASFTDAAVTQQPLYSDYKGVRIGMSAEETRGKLGAPVLKDDSGDYYIISPNEAAQIAYDRNHKVVAISVDYSDGIGAPDPKTVVGDNLELKNGSSYKMVRYESLGFWVSYNRSGDPVIVTITLQKIAP